MSLHAVRPRDFETQSSRRARAPRLGGARGVRHLDLILLGTLATSALAAVAVLVARGLAALG